MKTNANWYLCSETCPRLEVRTLLCSLEANTQIGGQIYRKEDGDCLRRKPEKEMKILKIDCLEREPCS